MKKLRIAQLAPPRYPVPPKKYGGTELVVYNLTEELVKRGHQVTLFASGDSKTKAKLISVCPKALDPQGILWKEVPYYLLLHVSEVFERAEQFDIIHNHFGPFGLVFSRLIKTPVITTLHWDLSGIKKYSDLYLALEKYKRNPFVAISNSQRRLSVIKLNFLGTVYNGIDLGRFEFNPRPKSYLAWLGRIDKKKGILEAIEVAQKIGLTLKIGASIGVKEFYEKEFLPKVDGKQIQFLGELDHQQKVNLLKDALALLFPITWNEPFGLVMVEALACGTPVIAFRYGSVPEIVKDGQTGFITKNIKEMIQAVKRIKEIDRRQCRNWVERKFNLKRMVDGYERLYYKLLNEKT